MKRSHTAGGARRPDFSAPLDGRVRDRSVDGSERFEASPTHRAAARRGRDRDRDAEADRELAIARIEDAAASRRVVSSTCDACACAPCACPPILTEAELEQMRRTTPRPKSSRDTTDEELANAIEGTWRTRWGRPTVLAEVALDKLRAGGGS